MATPPDAVRTQLAVVTATAAQEIASLASNSPLERQADAAIAAVRLIVPAYYDAAGSLAVAYYDEVRDEAAPSVSYAPSIVGNPETDWIERELEEFRKSLDLDLESLTRSLLDEASLLAGKEIARGYRESILGNTRDDTEAVGWSRIVRPGSCKFCVMLAGKGSVYRAESTAIFAAHKSCNCAALPKFRNGEIGPEANVVQYLASSRRARSPREQEARNKRVRAYLNANYPDAPG